MGQVTVNIQDESQLAAILVLSRAIENLTKVLAATPYVQITDCTLVAKGEDSAGVIVNTKTASLDFRQETIEVEDDEHEGTKGG